jgi:protocatechuate 3,4-dioxygenase beta subunit
LPRSKSWTELRTLGIVMSSRRNRFIASLGVALALAVFAREWLGRSARSNHPAGRAQPGLTRAPTARAIPTRASTSVAQRSRERTGIVRAPSGAAKAGATVCASAFDPRHRVRCTDTDESGRFVMRDLDQTRTDWIATSPGFLPGRIELDAQAAAAWDAAPLVFTLEQGGVEIRGSVIDATGGVITGALVSVGVVGASSPSSIVVAGGDGSFRTQVEQGLYEVVARADGYSHAMRRVRAPAHGVALALAPAASIAGKVVRGDSGEPAGGVTVSARPASGGFGWLELATSGEDGAFRIDGIRGGGHYHVQASGDAWRGSTESIAVDVGQTSESVVLRVFPAVSVSGRVTRDGVPCEGATLEASGPLRASARAARDGSAALRGLIAGRYDLLVECPGAAGTREELIVERQSLSRKWDLSSGLSVSGRVEDPNGTPLAGVGVELVPVNAEDGAPAARCSSGSDGKFACSGLVAGDYDCYPDLPDSERDRVRISLGRSSVSGVRLRAGGFGKLSVRVSKPEGAASDVWVFARPVGGIAIEGKSHASRFEFERLPLGRYDVYVNQPTAGAKPVILERHGQSVELELSAPESLSIGGRVIDDEGTPCLDAWVSARGEGMTRASSPLAGPALTDDSGAFELRGLTPGRYDLEVRGARGAAALQGVLAGANEVVLRITELRHR